MTMLLSASFAPTQAATRVVIGTAGGYGDSSAAIHAAVERGDFARAGIDVEVIDFKGGAPAIQALVGGGVQYCICAPEHVIRLRNRGVDGMVAYALDTRHTYVLVAKGSSTAKSFADLKGKRVGITSSGSLTESLIRLEARRNGLDADSDLEIVGAGVGAAMKAAIDTGRIEAGMFGNLDAEALVKQGYRIVFDWRPQKVPSLALLSTARWQNANADVAKAVITIVRQSQAQFIGDRSFALQYLHKIYPTVDDAILAADAEGLKDRLSADGIYDAASLERLQNDLRTLEPSLKPVPYGDAMPTAFLK